MDRRNFLGGAASALGAPGPLAAAQMAARKGLPALKITKVRTIVTQPADSQLVIVKVETSEPGLYGIGCATHSERPLPVVSAIEKHIGPYIIGRNCDEIEDIWQSVYIASYFRSGVTLNNALERHGRRALGHPRQSARACPCTNCSAGKPAPLLPLYAHASSGRDLQEVEDHVREWMATGLPARSRPGGGTGLHRLRRAQRHIRRVQRMRPDGVIPSPASTSRRPTLTTTLKLFEYLRKKLGFDVELLHDVHERVPPAQALQLATAP